MNKKLLLFATVCLMLVMTGASKAQVLLTENFSSATLPAGWTNDSLGLPAANLWLFNNPFARVITGAGFDANFAIFDSDELLSNDSILELASLTTPSIDISTVTTTLYLELDEQFRSLAPPTGEAKRHIEYSTDGGLNWVTVVYDSLDYGYPTAVHSMYNLSAAIGSSSLLVRFTWTGDYDWWWALDNVQVIAYANCTSPPEAGAASSTDLSVCPTDDFTLSLIGADIGIDLTYQWQSSPDGSTWSDITGATSSTYLTTQATSTYYQCIVTCTGVSDTSAAVQVLMSPPNGCYCEATTYTCVGVTGNITNVSIIGTGLNNSSACDELTSSGFSIWPVSPTTSANLVRGTAYDFSVTTDDNNIVSIWIDFDMNGGFEPGEWIQVCTTSVANVANTVNWLIPNSASSGATRMRVRARLQGNQNDSTSSCLEFFSGESEDYAVGLDFNVGVQKLETEGASIYPNPGTGLAYIFFENTVATSEISVFDHQGRLADRREVNNVFSTILDLSSHPDGIYLIRIQADGQLTTLRYILTK